MREDGKQQVCIVGLQEYKVSDVETIKELIEKGSSSRSTGTTGANEESSRSHAILQLAIKRSADGSESKPPRLVGKLSFIDLAGSERGADTTDNDKQTRSDMFVLLLFWWCLRFLSCIPFKLQFIVYLCIWHLNFLLEEYALRVSSIFGEITFY